jgi:hypothetical protein
MVVPFARHVRGAEHRIPGWVPVLQVELKTERFVMAFRLLLGCTFIRAESEQNSSHPCARPSYNTRWQVLGRAVKCCAVDRAAAKVYNAKESFNLERLIAD